MRISSPSRLVLANIAMCTMVVFAMGQETTIAGKDGLDALAEDVNSGSLEDSSDVDPGARSLGDYFGSIFPATSSNSKQQDTSTDVKDYDYEYANSGADGLVRAIEKQYVDEEPSADSTTTEVHVTKVTEQSGSSSLKEADTPRIIKGFGLGMGKGLIG